MKRLTIEYPESVLASLNMSPESFEEEARMAYELGRLAGGQAAYLIELHRQG
jgi:hypothetical protein